MSPPLKDSRVRYSAVDRHLDFSGVEAVLLRQRPEDRRGARIGVGGVLGRGDRPRDMARPRLRTQRA